jgi:hypothetical protein
LAKQAGVRKRSKRPWTRAQAAAIQEILQAKRTYVDQPSDGPQGKGKTTVSKLKSTPTPKGTHLPVSTLVPYQGPQLHVLRGTNMVPPAGRRKLVVYLTPQDFENIRSSRSTVCCNHPSFLPVPVPTNISGRGDGRKKE